MSFGEDASTPCGSFQRRSLCLIATADDGFRGGVASVAHERDLEIIFAESLARAHAWLSANDVSTLRYALLDDELPDGSGLEIALRLDALGCPPAVAVFGDPSCTTRALAAFRLGHALLPRTVGVGPVFTALEAVARKRGGASSEEAAPSGELTLEQHGVRIASEFIPMAQTGLATLRFLQERGACFTSSADIALRLLGRRDRASHSLVRRYVADTRRALGEYSWLIETVPKVGYRLVPRTSELTAAALS